MNHSQSAIDSAKGSTWDLDDYAERHNWEGVGIAYGIHRDSDVLYRSNWEGFLEEFKNDFSDEDFDVAHLGHWAVGWVEHLVFNTANENIAKLVEDLKKKLEDYPILDEERYGEMEWDENHPLPYTGRSADGECYSEDTDCPCGRKKV